MLKTIPILLLIFFTNCSQTNINDMQPTMKYETAFNLSVSYGESKHLDIKERLKVKTDQRFRFDFNSTDISYDKRDSTLVIRSCIEREGAPKREDFLAVLGNLNQKYAQELANGYLEYDESALEVDGIDPYRLNIRYDIKDGSFDKKNFIAKVNELHIAAKRWGNKYYDAVYEELNKTWKKDSTFNKE